jgi:hypothetical protein
MTIVRRTSELLGSPYNVFVPLSVVASVLLIEHAITFAAPLWERCVCSSDATAMNWNFFRTLKSDC